MPNIKSAAKRLRQSEKRRLRNRAAISAMKTAIKKVEECVKNNDFERIQQVLAHALSVISKNAQKGVIHPNAAARRQSRLTKKVNRFLASQVSTAPPSPESAK